jgi:hypothetical protein
MSSKMLPRIKTASILGSANTASPKTATSIPNKSILQQSSSKLVVGLPRTNPVAEKSISKPGGLVYKTSRWIAGLFSNLNEPEPAPSAPDQPTFTLGKHFLRIPGMIAMFGDNPDISPYIEVAAWGQKVENQTAIVVLKLRLLGMRMDGRFRHVTLRARFTDGNDGSNTYFVMIS